MRHWLAAIGVLFVLASATTMAHADETAKQKDIRKLLKMTGSGELGAQVMAQMLGNMKQSMPNVPEKFWSDFMKDVRTEELVDLIVPIYDRNLTHDDIKELIRFYDSATGKKFVAVLPKITQESMGVGEKWGRDLAERIIKKLQAQQQQQKK